MWASKKTRLPAGSSASQAGTPASAQETEWQALELPGQARALYLQAGDRYMAEDDPAGAVRSYGGALDAGTTDDLEVSVEDNWLLMAIKLARKKENERCE